MGFISAAPLRSPLGDGAAVGGTSHVGRPAVLACPPGSGRTRRCPTISLATTRQVSTAQLSLELITRKPSCSVMSLRSPGDALIV
jgi:hypothetical protein